MAIRFNDGTGAPQWVQVNGAIGGPFLPTTGGTMSGDLTITKSGPGLNINKTSDADAVIRGQRNGLNRWVIDLANGIAEPGTGNDGSHFNIYRYSDAGTLLDAPVTIARSTGGVSLSGDLTISKTWPTILLSAATSTAAQVIWQTAAKSRWTAYTPDTESGSNSGSNLTIARHNDAGTYLDAPLVINRATGVVTATGLAPRPTLAAGVGQWISIAGSTGAACVLPAGGTWAWFAFGYVASNMTIGWGVASGSHAGGTTVITGQPGIVFIGTSWRIA
jgi:hypothetical protein